MCIRDRGGAGRAQRLWQQVVSSLLEDLAREDLGQSDSMLCLGSLGSTGHILWTWLEQHNGTCGHCDDVVPWARSTGKKGIADTPPSLSDTIATAT
eukprot:2266557-Alexandrium_andersonii.AAC.1